MPPSLTAASRPYSGKPKYPEATVPDRFTTVIDVHVILSGWMAYDQGLYGVAQRYYLLALHACREGSCPDLGAKVIGDMTQLSTALGQREQAQVLAQAALYSLPRQASSLVRSELLGLESRACAQLGDGEAATADRSAQDCVAVYEEAPREDPAPDWIHYIDQQAWTAWPPTPTSTSP